MNGEKKPKTNENLALIRIECLDEREFCNIHMDNLCKGSFLRDGKHFHILIRVNVKTMKNHFSCQVGYDLN